MGMRTLLVGTNRGLYRFLQRDGSWVRDSVLLPDFWVSSASPDGRFVTTHNGSLFLLEGGVPRLVSGLPAHRLWTVEGVGGRLLLGTTPARLYSSADGGNVWSMHEGLEQQAVKERWRSHLGRAHLHSIAVGPALAIGIEAAGAFSSADAGVNWERIPGIDADVHKVAYDGRGILYASTGSGVFLFEGAWRQAAPLPLSYIQGLSFDRRGNLFVSASRAPFGRHGFLRTPNSYGIFRIHPDGSWAQLGTEVLRSGVLSKALVVGDTGLVFAGAVDGRVIAFPPDGTVLEVGRVEGQIECVQIISSSNDE